MKVAEIKAAVRERDGQRCTECGLTASQHKFLFRRTLDVHRKVPGSRYTVDGCVTLCQQCHMAQSVHPRKAKMFDTLFAFRVSPSWLNRGKRIAASLQIDLPSYIRMTVTQRMDADGVPLTNPKPRRPPKPRN